MRVLKAIILFSFFIPQGNLKGQSVYPKNYFQSPMDTPLYLSAPFGSLRDNHFHSGMDIRTYEVEGLPVYAVADGYVARIKYASNGYGKAVYINHPNGYTSVYGHLQKTQGELADYIKRYQYEIERFDFDHFPGNGKLKVTRGQIIGWSGNSGGSTGPHLHFEIRETKTEEVINPQLFGIPGTDLFPPAFKRVALYALDANRPVLTSLQEVSVKNTTYGADSILTLNDTFRVSANMIGMGAEVYDYFLNTKTEYSIYRLELKIDGKKLYAHTLDRFAFDDSRCINMHIDYGQYKESKIRIQKCFKDDGNRIRIYNYLRNRGRYILPKDSIVHELLFTAADVDGRETTLRCYLRFDAGVSISPVPKGKTNYAATFYPTRNNVYKLKDVEITIPPKALYDTLLFSYTSSPSEKYGYSPVHVIQDIYTPLNSSISVSLKTDASGELVKEKLLLAAVGVNGSLSAVGGGYDTDKNGWVTARTSTFSNMVVVADSVAPVIKMLNASKDGEVKDSSGLTIQISDNLSGIASWRLTINGKWVLTDYDAKNDLLVYLFDDKTVFNQKQEAVITVNDKKGNTTTVKRDLVFMKK